jgi:nucleoside-diphosphate-sugar epimerase
MPEFNIGDLVMIKNDPENRSTIVDCTIEETGRLIYKVERKGYFYPEDLNLPTEENTKVKAEEKKIVMVTGGAGYAGSILIRKLLQNGFRVVCIDSLRFGGSPLVDVWDNPDFIFKRVDVTNYNDIDEVLKSYPFFAVVHLAAIVGDPACKLEPELAVKTNRDASIHLLEKVMQLNIKRFVFSSTCSNYGKMKDTNGYVDETSPLQPVSLYAKLKVEFEDLLLNKIERSEEFSPTSLRFSTVYGISPRMRFDLTVNEFTERACSWQRTNGVWRKILEAILSCKRFCQSDNNSVKCIEE